MAMVRLVRAVKRLETAWAAAEEPPEVEREPVCLIWHGRSPCVDAATLQAGEYIAVDVVISVWGDTPRPLSPRAPLGVGERFRQVSESERITTDESDLGWVSNEEGRRIGRVTAIDRELLTWDLDADWREHVPSELPPIEVHQAEASADAGDGGSSEG